MLNSGSRGGDARALRLESLARVRELRVTYGQNSAAAPVAAASGDVAGRGGAHREAGRGAAQDGGGGGAAHGGRGGEAASARAGSRADGGEDSGQELPLRNLLDLLAWSVLEEWRGAAAGKGGEGGEASGGGMAATGVGWLASEVPSLHAAARSLRGALPETLHAIDVATAAAAQELRACSLDTSGLPGAQQPCTCPRDDSNKSHNNGIGKSPKTTHEWLLH